MGPGRRASMRSVRTLPIVHEDDDMIVVTTPEAAAAYPVRQKRHSGVVQALPPLGADDVAEHGSASGSEDEESSPNSNPNSNNNSPSRRINNPRRYSSGSVGSIGSVGSVGSNGSHRSHRSQYAPPPQRPYFAVAGGPTGVGVAAAATNYPYANPACSESSEESGITDRKLEENSHSATLRNSGLPKRSQNREWFAKRGGWWRLVLTLVLLAAIAVGLGVGLKYGLQKVNSDQENDGGEGNSGGDSGGGDSSGSNSTPSEAFPAGSYTFTVALTNVSTACTTNGYAFGCAPGSDHIFSPAGSPASQNASAVTHAWVIAGTTSQSTSGQTTTTYSVSSSSSSSSSSSEEPSFNNIHMTLLDAGLLSERLVFNFSMDLAYVPTNDLIAAQTSSATCYFNQTAFSATLWTKQRATFPPTISGVTAPVNASSTFSPWPFAVQIAEVQQAAPAIPDCVDYHGNSLGNFSAAIGSDSSSDNSGVCGCWYSNTVGGSSNGTSTR
ncbi:hypothetical protein SBRCBS47491_000497 [Sporothrix bragantina]|uniref:Tat pathway signal sequence n=1 Tax=Sporothrix bragantina TaxID=671064 RepID=A0ABP0AQV3_9PEZI